MAKVPGTFKTAPGWLRRAQNDNARLVERIQLQNGSLHAEAWLLDECQVLVTRDPTKAGPRWHMSISHRDRYPTWDEIKTAAYGIDALRGVTLAQVFTPGDGTPWVNVHENCLHIYEIHDEAMMRA